MINFTEKFKKRKEAQEARKELENLKKALTPEILRSKSHRVMEVLLAAFNALDELEKIDPVEFHPLNGDEYIVNARHNLGMILQGVMTAIDRKMNGVDVDLNKINLAETIVVNRPEQTMQEALAEMNNKHNEETNLNVQRLQAELNTAITPKQEGTNTNG